MPMEGILATGMVRVTERMRTMPATADARWAVGFATHRTVRSCGTCASATEQPPSRSARDLHRTLKRGGGIRFVRSAFETTRGPAVVRFSLAGMKATRLRTTRRFIELLSADE